ncbi:putative polyketide synthase peptide synthetase protein [Eutypa lata UCREL1]|uniref:Putative polyketide synthase peptide synthetase protein n=1 Tax=Eutypa lata (strain UCR-EL1) TaxID=1287681 RepID=M7TGQ0_EUTLA|nr:putative polyketide synthase peptide synthetase protein [Eutypa lata UCREL1]
MKAIVNCGADTSFAKTYASLRACNLQSTVELMAMTASCMPVFHYVSTLSVGHVLAAAAAGTGQGMPGRSGSGSGEGGDPPAPDDNVVFGPVSAAAYEPEQVPAAGEDGFSSFAPLAHGYIASKWASERFLERLKSGTPRGRFCLRAPPEPNRPADQRIARPRPHPECAPLRGPAATQSIMVPKVAGGRG